MKYLLPALTMVLGLVIGAWVPQSDLRVVKNELANLKKECAKGQKSGSSNQIVGNVTQLLGVQAPADSQKSPKNPPKRPTVTLSDNTEQVPGPESDDAVPIESSENGPTAKQTPEDFYEVIDIARDAWHLRSTQSRQALAENLDLNDDELTSFDHTISEMNKKLEDEIIDIAELMVQKEELTTEDGLMMVNRVSGVLLDTYNQLDTVLPDMWRDQTGNEADLINYVDPTVAMPLGNLQGMNFRGQPK